MTRLSHSMTSSATTVERRKAIPTARSRKPRLSTPASSAASAAATAVSGNIDDGWFARSSHSSSSQWMRSCVSPRTSSEEHSPKTALCCGYCTDSNRSPRHPRRAFTMAGLLQPGLLLYLCLAFFIRSIEGSMDITAFEYQRKFHKPLNLGECPQREVAIDLGNNSMHIEEQRCTLHQAGTVMHLPRELNDSRNVLITSPGGIVAYLGLCGGEAASFLGILNSGDCVAVEIASRLTFNEKTMIRAFVGYYRKSLDILDSQTNSINDGMDRYYRDKFYLKNRSYGTLEIIFVQFRFRTSRLTNQAKSIELPSPVMSDYMKAMARAVGKPQSVIVINLSTATQETYELKRFKEGDWDRAVRDVQVKELRIQKTRDKINTNALSPHLKYQLFPFMDTGDRSVRLTNPIPWEKISMLEVQLRQAIELAKKTCRKCRGNKTKMCRRVRELRRKLISAQAEIHKGRSNWVKLTTEEKSSFATRYTARVKSYSSVTRSLAKSVREMRKNEKMKKLTRKRNRMNQIPMRIDKDRQGSTRRIRHSRRRNKVRKG